MKNVAEDILSYFPCQWHLSEEILGQVQEIRVRLGQAVLLKCCQREVLTEQMVEEKLLLQLLENFTNNSVYAVQSELNEGFITIKGGHRIGIAGTCLWEEDKIKNIRYISSLNIRVAHEIKGCGTGLVNRLYSTTFANTLILSPPGCGKTTLLRDMIRLLSCKGYTISVIDERAEIAAMYKGKAQNDLGPRTDVMNHCRKEKGIRMMIRSMAPQIIATDEIGDAQDVEAIYEAHFAGIQLLLTAHGEELQDIPEKLLKNQMFQNIVILQNEKVPGKVKKIYHLQEDKYVADC